MIGIFALVAALAACGGTETGDPDTDGGLSGVTSPDTDDGSGSGEETEPGSSGAFDLPEGMVLSDGLIPELSHIPLPGGEVAFEAGSAHTVEQDPRETAVQAAHLEASVQEAAEFYLEALPAAGFELDDGAGAGITDPSDIQPEQNVMILFNDPDGVPGQLRISPGAFSPSFVNINLFRSGTR